MDDDREAASPQENGSPARAEGVPHYLESDDDDRAIEPAKRGKLENTMANQQRRSRDLCVPGLVPQAFVKGSRHTAVCPTLKTSDVDAETGECIFEWEATGSSGGRYHIKAVGTLEVVVDSRGNPVGKNLKVTCSCPDGERQAAASLDKIIVCKHGAAALGSVLDDEAIARHEAHVNRLRRQRQEEATRQRHEEERAQEAQEREMPGERARIEYGLQAWSDGKIRQHLKDSCKTVEGLRALKVLLPEAVMPTPQTKYCVRCKKNYDERYQEQRVCRVEHPFEHCNTEWDGSKISWSHCYRCDGDFDIPDYYRGRNRPYDSGKWCFEGKHTQDEDQVEEENWNADPGSLVY